MIKMKNYNKDNIKLAKNLRKNLTPWERKLWYDFLRTYPVRFQRQKTISNYIVDFYCARARLIIELDGGGHYEEKQKEKDSIRTQELEKMNLKILRFCNIDIDNNFYSVCEQIDNTVKSRVDF
ncbi:MAG: endonuclease domain-containing protein [Clostridia bacterium]|nr:endonuclease domain-containing protein [Clostridia bacterium]